MKATLDFCPVDGARIAYDRAGTGPVVVFLHGIGGNRLNWGSQLETFSDSYTCIAWDAMGYGDSGDSSCARDFQHFARELVAVLDHIGAAKAHIVGTSMGGHIALSLYRAYPDRVATLSLVATNAGMANLTEAERHEFVRRRVDPLTRGAKPADIAVQILDVLVGRHATNEARNRVIETVAAVRTEPYIDTVHAIVTTDFRELLAKIAVPTLILVGGDDRVFPVSESQHLAEHITGAVLRVVPEIGHLFNIEAPGVFAAALGPFLEQHRSLATSLRP
jgi:3-oxoadipate enol-lactonase